LDLEENHKDRKLKRAERGGARAARHRNITSEVSKSNKQQLRKAKRETLSNIHSENEKGRKRK